MNKKVNVYNYTGKSAKTIDDEKQNKRRCGEKERRNKRNQFLGACITRKIA